jgi:hypothetical protein
VVISVVSEGAETRFSNCEVISGVIERSSPRLTTADDLDGGSEMCGGLRCESGGARGECEVSEAKCGAFGESSGCLFTSGRSGECLGTTGGREGSAGSPGGDRGGCA